MHWFKKELWRQIIIGFMFVFFLLFQCNVFHPKESMKLSFYANLVNNDGSTKKLMVAAAAKTLAQVLKEREKAAHARAYLAWSRGVGYMLCACSILRIRPLFLASLFAIPQCMKTFFVIHKKIMDAKKYLEMANNGIQNRPVVKKVSVDK